MVYLEKKNVNGKEYYRLVYAIRKGNKVTHKVKYIGKKLPPKKRLEQLKKELSREIYGQGYKYLSQEDIKKIESKKSEYKKDLKKASKLEKEKRLKEFIIRFTYDSSKLAGVNVTLRQTSLILKEGIIPKNFKNIQSIKEVENHEKGFIAITKYKGKLDIRFLKNLHKILFLGIDDSIAGKLRNEIKRNVGIAGTPYVPQKWQMLKKELGNFFKWYKSENRKLHPLELAALIHLRLISIQLFVDGNSRLARLLMNWVLWKKQCPMIDIPIEDLEAYYNVLDKYQIEKQEKPFIDYIKKKYLMI